MKQPKFELPLKTDSKAVTNNKNQLYLVLSNKQDAEFIVEACNNYKEVVELLDVIYYMVEVPALQIVKNRNGTLEEQIANLLRRVKKL